MFKGKSELMNKNIDKALEYFAMTQTSIRNMREFETITWYETGYLHLLDLRFDLALECFLKFSEHSKWSIVFNHFILSLLYGACGQYDKANENLNSKVKLCGRKNPIEAYAFKRMEYLRKLKNKTDVLFQFFCIELTYLWVYLPFASESQQIKTLESK
jgi:hypothetical protein